MISISFGFGFGFGFSCESAGVQLLGSRVSIVEHANRRLEAAGEKERQTEGGKREKPTYSWPDHCFYLWPLSPASNSNVPRVSSSDSPAASQPARHRDGKKRN